MSEEARRLYIRSIGAFRRFIGELKWFLKHFRKSMTGEEIGAAKSEIRRCGKELEEAKLKLKERSFINPIDAQIATSEAERRRAVKKYKAKAEARERARREKRETEALEAHREAVKKALDEDKPPPPPPKRRNGKSVSGLDFLLGG